MGLNVGWWHIFISTKKLRRVPSEYNPGLPVLSPIPPRSGLRFFTERSEGYTTGETPLGLSIIQRRLSQTGPDPELCPHLV